MAPAAMISTLVAASGLLLLGAVGPGSLRTTKAASRPLPLAQVDVSRRTGAQFESAVVVAPSDSSVLLAGSNDVEPRGFDVLAYTSTDGGASWVTSHPYTGSECAIADPATAIDANGRELFSYLVAPCRAQTTATTTSVYVSTRSGPAGPWTAVRVAGPLAAGSMIDKPSLAWDSSPSSPDRGRAYAVWVRIRAARNTRRAPKANLWLAHSDNGGTSWSKPTQIRSPTLLPSNVFPGVAVAPSGELYVAWTNNSHDVFIARSSGGESFTAAVTVVGDTFFANPCYGFQLGAAVPAQDRRCVTTTPTVVAAANGVTVFYAAPGADGRELDIFARSYDPRLRPLHRPVRVNPPDGETASDQFEPAAALDTKTGLVWVCFYDTRGDRSRRTVRFSCTASKDGIRWKQPLALASVRSDETRAPATRFQYGDYQGLAIGRDGVAHPTWTDARNLRRRGEEIYTTTLTATNLGY
jgi:hypothetical protein